MRIRTLAVVVAALIAVDCDSSTAPPSGALPVDLAQAESKWKSQEVHDYFFDFHHQFGGAIEAARIYVSSDNVAAAVDSATGKDLPLDPGLAWPTVDSLFARARAALESKDVEVSVSYDATLGYPTHIDVSPAAATPAGGSSTSASNLKRMVVLTPQ
jgi:hypothetical protein